jgi:hypothetical protein
VVGVGYPGKPERPPPWRSFFIGPVIQMAALLRNEKCRGFRKTRHCARKHYDSINWQLSAKPGDLK